MSKYKVGDKVAVEITAVSRFGESYEVAKTSMWTTGRTESVAEPLSTYTKPLEAKIKNQAAEITRLLEENKKLKAENGNNLWNIEQARAEGQNEAWELALKLRYMDYEDKLECFGLKHDGEEKWVEIMEKYTYQEAAAKVEAWEKEKEEIKRGDEVEKNDLRDVRFIVTFTNGKFMSGVTQSGLVFSNEKTKDWHKTGRHIDIDSFLKQIGGEE